VFRLQVTPEIELRLFEPEDAAEIFGIVERDRTRLREWLPWVDQTHSPADLVRFIQRVHNQWNAGQGPQAVLWLNGRIAGSVGCHPIDWANRQTSIGYWLAAEYEGRGAVTLACAALTDYLFRELGLHRVTIKCGTGNHRSCAIPERLGFVREGVIREEEWVNDRYVDLVVWGMLEQDWRRR